MRNYLLSYPKSGRNRLELLCLLYLTKYIGTDSPLGYHWLKYWCRFTHFGYHNINIPDQPNPEQQIQYPARSTIHILRRDPVAVLCSMFRWYQHFPPEDKEFSSALMDGMGVDYFAVSKWGMTRLINYGEKLQILIESMVSNNHFYNLNFYQYEDTFDSFFVLRDIPKILNLSFQLPEEDCQWIIDHSSVEFVKEMLASQQVPDGYTQDIIEGIKIGMRGGHIKVGDPAGHKGQLQPETEQIIREAMKRTIL